MLKQVNIPRQAALLGIALTICTYVGCSSKKNDPAPAVKTKTQLLTAADWHVSKLEFGSTVSDLVVFPLIPQDARENFRFTSTAADTGSFISNVGNGTWALTNSETQFSLNITRDDSQGISASRTILQMTFNGDGTYTWIFPIKQYAYGYIYSNGNVQYFSEARESFSH